jgi:23S rRNA pseudouridine2605 synthase
MPRGPEAPGKRTQLARALSKLGLCSRGEAARRIAAGEVRVNGKPERDPEAWVELGRDRIEAEGVSAGGAAGAHRYYRMHKPAGYVTTRSDELGRKTVYDLLPPEAAGGWVFPVGRLDVTTEGLILLTNDGEFAQRVSHPRYEVPRVYHAKVRGIPEPATLARLREGVRVEGERLAVDRVRILEGENNAWVEVVLHEGKHHEVRRLLEMGYDLDLPALTEHCRTPLASFKVPKQLVIRDSLPRNPSGKILKRVLRAELETSE